jgi:hypothetical protein
MAESSFPFDGGSVAENQWGDMAQFWLGTGVIKGQLNLLNTFADSTGMQVKVDTGKAWVQGYFYKNDALKVLPISAANATNPRIDRVILRLDFTANSITVVVLAGTPAASPVPPVLTQSVSKWEISLAQVYVGANVSTITAANITDERSLVGGLTPYFHLNNNTSQSYPTTGAFQYIHFSSGHINYYRDFTPGTDAIYVNQTGIYYLESWVHISGLNPGYNAWLTNRQITAGNQLIADHSVQQMGWQGAGGNNGGVWIHNAKLLRMNKGDGLNFLLQIEESPRNIIQLIVNCFKVSE